MEVERLFEGLLETVVRREQTSRSGRRRPGDRALRLARGLVGGKRGLGRLLVADAGVDIGQFRARDDHPGVNAEFVQPLRDGLELADRLVVPGKA